MTCIVLHQTLLSWHELDPADDFEMNRNNIIYSWQMNRNPFIDLPDLVDYVYGPLQNTPYQLPLSNTDVSLTSETFSTYLFT